MLAIFGSRKSETLAERAEPVSDFLETLDRGDVRRSDRIRVESPSAARHSACTLPPDAQNFWPKTLVTECTHDEMTMRRDVVVIGASAGGLDALEEIVRHLHADLPAAVLVVLHMPATSRSLLAPILNRIGGLPAVEPRHGDSLRRGYIYVAKPDQHLEVSDGVIQLTHGPRVNGNRPSIDVLFGSTAAAYGERVVGVVLSGSLDDGSGGLAAICAAGGYAIVQKPEDALIDSMPRNAIELAKPHAILPASEIGPMIAKIVTEPTPERHEWKE